MRTRICHFCDLSFVPVDTVFWCPSCLSNPLIAAVIKQDPDIEAEDMLFAAFFRLLDSQILDYLNTHVNTPHFRMTCMN